VAPDLAPELLLPLGVSKRRGIIDGPLHLGRAAGVGGRGLGAVSLTPHHHVTLVPPHEGPLLGFRGIRGPACPLIPPRRRGVVRDLHHLHLRTAGGRRRLCRLHRRPHLRLHGRGRLARRRGHHLWLCRRIHGRCHRLRPLRLLCSRHHGPCLRSGSLRGLHLHHGCRCSLRSHDGRRRPLLSDCRLRRSGLICRPRPRGLRRTLRALARRRRACPHPRRPRRAPPGGNGRVRPQHLGRCERRHGWHHPAQAQTDD
jgi:hypothetical protein